MTKEHKKNNSTYNIAMCGVLTALAMIFSYIESIIPVPIPVPGIKLGVANIAVITILYTLGIKEAVIINILRISLTAMLFGNLNSFLFSIAGAVLSMVTMIVLKKIDSFSYIGVSVSGAIMHNVGQIIAAIFIMEFFLGSVFGCVFVLLLFFTQCTYAKKQTFLLSNIALFLFGIALFVLFLSLDRLKQVKLSRHRLTVSSDVLIYCLCLLLFSAQLYISYNIYFETGWDAGLLTENARNLMHKHSVDIRYFSNYPNNLLYFFFELFVFKLNKYFSIFSDTP